jgi:hypothetical protein
METKINVFAQEKETTLRLGADVITLEDHTSKTFRAANLINLVEYLLAYVKTEFMVFYKNLSVVAFPKEITHDTQPIAELQMKEHAMLLAIRNLISDPKAPRDLDKPFRALSQFLTQPKAEGFALRDMARNLSISKNTQIKTTKDDAGNYQYLVSRESGGTLDVRPPECLAFTVPLFAGNMMDRVTIPVDVSFNYQEDPTTTSVKCWYEFSCPMLDDIVEERQAEVIETHLSVVSVEKYAGTCTITPQDDKWKYQRNDTDATK